MLKIEDILKETKKMDFVIEDVDNSKDAGFYDKNGEHIDAENLFNSFHKKLKKI